jgi:uncharacterized protein
MNTQIIYHQVKPGIDCPDGIASAAIVSLAYPDAVIVGDSYQDNDWYKENDPYGYVNCNLIIVDFSYPAHWLNYWEGNGCKVTVIDHHAPKFPMLSGFSGAILDANECGATLTWKTFISDEVPELLLHVRRRDIGADGYYQGLCRDSEAINEELAAMRHESDDPIELLQSLLKVEDSHSLCEMLRQAGESKLLERDRIIEAACDRCRLVKLGDHVVPYLQTTEEEDRHVSNIGNYMCRVLYPAAPFAWVKTHDGKSSLRSTGFDVSIVANEFGGGGHAMASGFSRSVDPVEL